MNYEDIKVGQVMSAKRYNELSESKWHRDWDKAKSEGRDWSMMPQRAFYGFFSPKTGEVRNNGFVRKTRSGAHWFKTKTKALEYVEKVYS